MRVGILTSGGDAPGMNAILYGAHRTAAATGCELIAIPSGYAGLAQGLTHVLDGRELLAVLALGGTVIGTSRWPALYRADGHRSLVEAAGRLRLDGLIVAGGAGSLAGAARLSAAGLRVVGVPATIDRDTRYDTVTIGMDSAVNYASRAIDDLRVTARALPGRAFLVETLGGDTGHLAGAVAEATGCRIVLRPEELWDAAKVAAEIKEELAAVGHSIAVMSEGAGNATTVAREIEGHLGERVRPTILGHSMRGTGASALDRTLGQRAGERAVRLVAAASGSAALMISVAGDMAEMPLHDLPDRA